MATEPVRDLSYVEAVTLHIMLMRRLGETRFGVFDRTLVESALARPRHAAIYEGAELASASRYALLRSSQKSSVGGRQQTHRYDLGGSFSVPEWN